MRLLLLSLSLFLLGSPLLVHAEGDPAAGQAKAGTCLACHGPDGNSVNPQWPKLAGQHPGYTKKQLVEFQSGEMRRDAMMEPMIANLSEQDMEDLAVFYAIQPRTGGFASEERAELGERIYRGGNLETRVAACIGCHGPRGLGDPLAGFPSLAGQHAAYVVLQLEAFRSGERSNDINGMMQDVARWMTRDEMLAVAEYIAGLH